MALYTGIVVTGAAAGVGVPLLIRQLIDSGLRTRNGQSVIAIGIIALALGLAAATASAVTTWLGAYIGGRVTFALRVALYEHLQSMPVAFFARSQTGALQSRITSDVTGAQTLLQNLLGSVASSAVGLVAAVTSMAVLSPLVTAVSLVATPVFLVPARHFGKQLRLAARRQAEEGAKLQSFTSERLNVGGALLLTLLGNRSRDLAGYRRAAASQRDVVIKRNATFARASFSLALLGLLGFGSVYVFGGLLAARGQLTVGTVVALALLVRLVYDPLANLAAGVIDVQGGLVSFERVFEVLDFSSPLTDPPSPKALPSNPRGSIEFQEVWFRYPNPETVTLPTLLVAADDPSGERAEWALSDVNWQAAPGSMTAVVGHTGAGKTTMASLLARLYDPSRGTVHLDGVDLKDLALDELRMAIGFVTQDAYLYNDSLAENLRVACPTASDAELLRVCELACLTELLRKMPAGIGTVVGDRGYRLSGGEKQRLALARVFLRNPRVVVLDEATAHLDSETERAIQEALSRALAERTLVVIAHRLTTVKHADQILVLERGRLVERGSHEELFLLGGAYRRLHDHGFDVPSNG